MRIKLAVLLGLALLPTVVLLGHGPIAQPADYHAFADQRALGWLPNAGNVLSNLGFLLVGGVGIARAWQPTAEHWGPMLSAYRVFFAAALLIGIGSAYYHVAPDNRSLVWDRLPMTLAFMALFCAVLGERVDARLGRRLLLPALLLGLASVLWWAVGDLHGQGDLRAYLLVQFLPMLLLPLLLLLFPDRHGDGGRFGALILLYVLAKAFELSDGWWLQWGGLISGHSLKHLAAAAAMAVLLEALQRRRQPAA